MPPNPPSIFMPAMEERPRNTAYGLNVTPLTHPHPVQQRVRLDEYDFGSKSKVDERLRLIAVGNRDDDH